MIVPIELYSPGEVLLRCMPLLLYVPFGIFIIRRICPRLSLYSKRLTIGLLLAQVIVISVSLVFSTTSDFWHWLWDLNREGNVPALLASAQYMLAGAVAILAAWHCPRQMGWQRFYLAAFGVLVLILMADESLALHDRNRDLVVVYVLLGPVFLALSALAAARAPKQNRIWHIGLVVGLGIAGFGEVVVEQFRRVHICGSVGFIELSRCLEPYYLEEPLAFLGIWLALVALLGHLSTVAPSPSGRVKLTLLVLPCLWMLLVFFVSPIHQPAPPVWAQPASVVFESGTQINGYQIDREANQVSVIMYFPVGLNTTDIGYSIHVVDQISLKSVISHNRYVRRRYRKVTGLHSDFWPLYNQKIALTFPPDTPTNHAYWIVLTLWRDADGRFLRQKILSSDLALHDNMQVILGEIALRDLQSTSSASLLAVFENGFTLEEAELPQRAQSGETLPLRFAWRSDVDEMEDHIQFLHLGNEDTGAWFVYDQQPLGPRLPTRLWYSGLADSETWQVPLPDDLAPGRYSLFTGLYRVADQERVPAADANGTRWLDNRVALGTLFIE